MEHVSPFEVVVINDGSNDGSARILDALRRDHPQLRVIHQLHTGQAQAIRRGYELARGTYVLELPLEGQFEPQHFWPLWERRLSYQLLIAFSENSTVDWLGRWTHRLLDRWIHFLFGTHFRPNLSNFRLGRTAVIAPLMKRLPVPFESVGLGISLLVHKEYPFGVREVPVTGSLGHTGGNTVVLAVEALQLWWSTRRPWFSRRKRKAASVNP
jgi:glycosyltransferase involved in cell wall biosynthesis